MNIEELIANIIIISVHRNPKYKNNARPGYRSPLRALSSILRPFYVSSRSLASRSTSHGGAARNIVHRVYSLSPSLSDCVNLTRFASDQSSPSSVYAVAFFPPATAAQPLPLLSLYIYKVYALFSVGLCRSFFECERRARVLLD